MNVGSLGLPEELTLRAPKLQRLYSFPDKLLGPHIERAYQALALNEDRSDFVRDSRVHAFMLNANQPCRRVQSLSRKRRVDVRGRYCDR